MTVAIAVPFFSFLCVDILLLAMTDCCLSDRNHQFHNSVVSGGLNAKDEKAVFLADSYKLNTALLRVKTN